MTSEETTNPTDIVRCCSCQTPCPELYCNTCRINLCRSCVSKHLTSQLSIQHSIVAYELRERTIKHLRCPLHVRYECELLCKICNLPICSQCCTEESHQTHGVKDIKNVYESKIHTIERDISNIEYLIVPEYENLITNIKNEITKLTAEYQELRKAVSELRTKWHDDIERLIKGYESKINEMERDNLNILNQNLSEIENILSDEKRRRQENINILNSNEGGKLLNYESYIKESETLPSCVHVTPPFIRSKSTSIDRLYEQLVDIADPVISFTEEYAILLPRVTIMDTKHRDLVRVSCASVDQVWINEGFSRDMMRIDTHGSVLQRVTPDSECVPYDMTVTREGLLVYTASWWGGGSMYQVKQGKSENIIYLSGWQPRGVCSTSGGDLLVCLTKSQKGKVVRYQGSQVKQRIMYDGNTPLYKGGTLFITESANNDIWVTDREAKAVVVTDKSGKFKFRYTGDLESKRYKTFSPGCIDSNIKGQVLVIDRDNECVHVIDDKGRCLFYIHDLCNPTDLSVDSKSYVWVCENGGKIKKIKY